MTAIPSVPKNADAETRRFLEAVKQILEIGTTDRAGVGESFVRTKDLVSGGIAKVNRAGTIAGVAVASQSVTPQVPNAITGLSATGVFTQIILDWTYGGPNDVEYFEVSRALGTQTIADAVVVGTTQAQVFADAGVTPGVEYLYWVRGVNDTKFGAYSDIDGVSATLDADILTELAALSGGVTENNLSQELIERMSVLSGNAQEVLDRSSAIAAEIIERKNADEHNQSQIDTVVADVAAVNSDLADEIAKRVTDFGNVYSLVFSNNGDITSLNSALSDEVTARQTAVSDLADTVAGQQTEITTTAEDLVAETTARVAQISSLDSQMAGVIETTTTLTSDLSAETTARTSALSAVENSVASLQTDVSTNATDISAETAARDSAISTINNTIASIETDVATNATDVSAETTARETAISTINSTIASIESNVATNVAGLTAETTARESAISTVNNTIASIESDVATNATDLTAETNARETAISTVNSTIASIQSDISTNATDISAETSTRESQYTQTLESLASIQTDLTTATDSISAEVTAREQQYATLNTAVSAVQTDVTTVASDLSAETTARTDQIASVNTSIATLTTDISTVANDLSTEVTALETAIANVGTDTAAVETIVNARVDPLEDAVEASYVLRANANNTVAGFSLFNSADEPSTFDIVADRFSVSPSYTSFPLDYLTLEERRDVDGSDGTGRNLLVSDRFFGDDLDLYVLFTTFEFEYGLSVGFVGTLPSGLAVANATMSVDFRTYAPGNTIDHDRTDVPVTHIADYSPTGSHLDTQPVYGVHIPVATGRNISFLGVSLTFSGSNVTPFTVDGTTGTVLMNNALIGTAAIGDAQIADLSASKITADNLAAISANLGNITAGTLQGPNNRFRIDLANNRLEVYDENDTLRVRLGDLS